MKENVILKSLLRKPVIGALLTLLIGLVSYGFVGKAVETIIVWRETNRLEGYYRSIGYITKDWEGEERPYAEGAALIGQSPAFAFGDLRRKTAGFMRDICNADFDSGTMDVPATLYAEESIWHGQGVYNLDYWFYGTLVEYQEVETKTKPILFSGFLLIFEVDQVLAGYPDRIQDGKNYVVWIPARYTAEIKQMEPRIRKMKVGQRYLMRAWSHPSFPFSVTGVNAVNLSSAFNLKPLDDDDLWYIPVGNDETLDLSLPRYEGMRLEIDRLNQNLRSISLIGTSDMSAMPEVQLDSKNYFLAEGRWLNREDEEEARPVIVVSKVLADAREITIGDSITLTMRALKDPFYSYIRGEEDIRHWREYPNITVTYEVVGIYSFAYLEESPYNYAWFSDSYVPNSTIPDELTLPHSWSAIGDKGASYSFVLTDPRLQDAFIEEFTPKLKELGFDLTFTDNNGRNFTAGADPLRKSTLIGSILFSAALLMAIALSVFLYLRQQRRNYAILRALGVPAAIGNKQLMLPLVGLGVIGSLAGSFLSWQNAHEKAAESLSKLPLPSGVLPELTLRSAFGVGFWLLVLLILVMMAYAGNRRVARTPVLELLQDSVVKKRATENAPADGQLGFDKSLLKNVINAPTIGKTDPKSALTHFYTSNILRSPVKSLLTIVVAAALLLALGWFQTLIKANKEEISRLYRSSQVQIDFFLTNWDLGNMIPYKGIEWVRSTGIMDHSYLSSVVTMRSELNTDSKHFETLQPYKVVALNNLEYGLERSFAYTEINFLPGYGPESFSADWLEADQDIQKIPLVVPEAILTAEGWTLGQELTLEFNELNAPLPFIIAGSFELCPIVYSEVMTLGDDTGFFQPMITYLPAIKHYYTFLPNYFEAAFYSAPDKNYQLKAFKNEILELQKETTLFPVKIQFWDEELLAVVEPMEQNLSLMEKLYPVTLFLAGVIGGVLCLLLILNQAKETALLRMLGVEKRRITRMQVGQIMALSLIGLALGTIALMALRGPAAAGWQLGIAALIYLAGALMGTLAANLQVSGKKPMELLQVKE